MRAVSVLLAFSLLTGFASGATASNPSASSTKPKTKTRAEIEIKLEQLPSSDLVVEQRGEISIAYSLTVRNASADAITLRKLVMKTLGRSPYVLRDEELPFNDMIEPGKEAVLAFSAWARKHDKGSKMVWIKGTATFDGPKGSFQTEFTQSFRQPD